ncbi:hypothetical protein OKA05_28675 [Luteolibacter arcticus]|uniref:Uncharacterized protein n=1 Tax=Luteolibacter arcticus TaxID=1581411 RepID=A0ABT3GSU5_9BACT|nr:hypothetical protein [Luteolibacter arcticus]MCW1926561.1 hypothetical protein [Luteolibacter arcticus]
MSEMTVDPGKLEELLTYCSDFAGQMLRSHGEFHPFGATLSPDGKVTAVGAWNGEEQPRGRELVEILVSSIIAAALAANVDIPAQYEAEYPDGIRVKLECEGYARNIYLPYRLGKRGLLARLGGKPLDVQFGEMIPVESGPYLRG